MVFPGLHRRAAHTPMFSEQKEGGETKAQTGFKQKKRKRQNNKQKQTKDKKTFKTVKTQFNHQQQKSSCQHYIT